MKLICKKCGDTFEATKYEKELIKKGLIKLSDIKLCSDCFEVENETPIIFDDYSNADMGL